MIDPVNNIVDSPKSPDLESPIFNEEQALEETIPLDPEIHKPDPLPEPKQEQSDFDLQRKQLSSKLSPLAYTASSVYHVLTGLGLAGGFLKPGSTFVKNATRFTKIINSLVYGDLAIDAWKGKQSFDFISKILEPTLNCFSQLSNYHLLRGLGSAMTQLHLVNFPHIDPDKTHWENFIANLQETKRFFIESWTSPLLGPNRRLGKGKHDEGHTMALLSHIQGLSGVLGLLNGSRRNLIDKIVGTTRNVIGIGVDLDLLFKKDPDEKKTGQYYFAHAIFDTLKRFVSKEKADVIDNLAMPLYNKAMYHFGKITRNQSEGTYVKTVNPSERKKPKLHSAVDEPVLVA